MAIWGMEEVALFRSGTLPREMRGGHSSHHDLFGDECQTDGQAVRDQSAERRDFTKRMKNEQKGAA
jgi:hypothetical protein